MMNAMIFDKETDALTETAKMQAWCNVNAPGIVKLPPIPFKGKFAVTLVEGYEGTGEIMDINAPPADLEEY